MSEGILAGGWVGGSVVTINRNNRLISKKSCYR